MSQYLRSFYRILGDLYSIPCDENWFRDVRSVLERQIELCIDGSRDLEGALRALNDPLELDLDVAAGLKTATVGFASACSSFELHVQQLKQHEGAQRTKDAAAYESVSLSQFASVLSSVHETLATAKSLTLSLKLISASGPLTDQSQQPIEIRISGHELKTLIEEPPSNDELPAYSPPTQLLPGSLSTTSAKNEAITPASERSDCFDEETREAQQSGTSVNDLHSAIEQNDSGKIKHLLQEGVDPNAQSGRLQRNALHQAALHDRAECVRLLVDNGALVDAEEGKGDTALHLATWKGHAEVVDALLTHGADIDRLSGRDGNTPLWCAISKGDSALTELFLDRGADPDIRSLTDLLPLHHAAVSGQDKLCKLLAEHGADIHCRDGEGNTPLHYAATTGQKSVISVLLHEGARHSDVQNQGLSALHWAAHKGHRDALEALLDGDAEKDLLADSSTTPLHCAASRGHRACVKLLLDAGVDRTICTTSWDGNFGTAAELARANGHAQIASMIQFYTGSK